jgi:KaiC/GvpD/RAD55 family RecA-like ATPase
VETNEVFDAHIKRLYGLLNHAGSHSQLHAQLTGDNGGVVDRRLITNEEELVKWAKEYNGKANLFIGRANRDGRGQLTVSSVLTLDVDPIRPKGTAASEAQHAQAIEAGRAIIRHFQHGVLASSGNGSLVIFPTGRSLAKEECESLGKALEVKARSIVKEAGLNEIEIDSTWDHNRLIKLIGTKSTKGDPSLHRQTRFINTGNTGSDLVRGSQFIEEIQSYMGSSMATAGATKLELGKGQLDRSRADFAIAVRLQKQGFSAQDTYQGLLEYGFRGREDDAKRIVEKLYNSGAYGAGSGGSVQPYANGFTDHGAESKAEDLETFLDGDERVEWIVRGLLAESSINFIAGLPETFKTWIMADLAIECARGGGEWLGMDVKKSRVLFIDQERYKGETRRRIKALLKGKRLDKDAINKIKDDLHIEVGTSIKINLEQSYKAFSRKLEEIKPDLIIVDSFATFHTAGENDRTEIQKVIEVIKRLREQHKCSFIFIDHENKGVLNPEVSKELPTAFNMVGSVGKPAAAEMILTVRKEEVNKVTIYNTKNTLAPSIGSITLYIADDPETDGIILKRV